MVSVRDVKPHTFIKACSIHLKRSGKLQIPDWVDLVKTGVSRELAPLDPDWFYVRAAAIARQIYLRPGIGVGALRTKFGGPKNRGTRPSRHKKGSGSVIRKALQSLEQMDILKKNNQGGRLLTSKGQSELDRVAMTCLSDQAFIQ